MKYDKLVRDGIPAIIEKSGKTCSIRVLDDAEYAERLRQKLHEEVAEFEESGELDELADICEVVRALAAAGGYSPDELEAVRAHKAAERGGFEKRILLTEVE